MTQLSPEAQRLFERWKNENPDFIATPHIQEGIAKMVTAEIAAGSSPEAALDLATAVMRESLGKPQPPTPDIYNVGRAITDTLDYQEQFKKVKR